MLQHPDVKPYDYKAAFPGFYKNRTIKKLAKNKRWTVSTTQSPDGKTIKKPVDLEALQDGKIWGVPNSEYRPPHMTDLKGLMELIPNASNCTYRLDAALDQVVCLDIESSCPEHLKNELLKMPALYCETSLSGKGVHMLFPLPECIQEYPDAMYKLAMKDSHNHYEILMYHCVTFTRNVIRQPKEPARLSFESLFRVLCERQKPSVSADIDFSVKDEALPNENVLLRALDAFDYEKTPAHFGNDMSRYEYGFMGFYESRLEKILDQWIYSQNGEPLTDGQKALLLYKFAKDRLPYRAKHDEKRNGWPWLLYQAVHVVAAHETAKKGDENNDIPAETERNAGKA